MLLRKKKRSSFQNVLSISSHSQMQNMSALCQKKRCLKIYRFIRGKYWFGGYLCPKAQISLNNWLESGIILTTFQGVCSQEMRVNGRYYTSNRRTIHESLHCCILNMMAQMSIYMLTGLLLQSNPVHQPNGNRHQIYISEEVPQ